MEENRINVKEVPVMPENDFREYLSDRRTLNLSYFWAVSKFKSVGRAFRRGHITSTGYIAPSRPFNNRKDTRGRSENISKKKIYEQLRNIKFSA